MLPVLCLIVLSVLILVLVSFVMQPTAIFLVLWTIYIFVCDNHGFHFLMSPKFTILSNWPWISLFC